MCHCDLMQRLNKIVCTVCLPVCILYNSSESVLSFNIKCYLLLYCLVYISDAIHFMIKLLF